MSSVPRILPQGAIDGACFLYATANAMRTLFPDNYSIPWGETFRKRWNEALVEIPFPLDFLRYDVGTERYNLRGPREGDPVLYLHALSILFDKVSGLRVDSQPRLQASHVDGEQSETPRDLLNLIDADSVLLLCITKTDNQPDLNHWVCATGKPGRGPLQIACSWVLANPNRKSSYVYAEERGYQGRLFNDWIEDGLDDPKVIGGPVFRVAKPE